MGKFKAKLRWLPFTLRTLVENIKCNSIQKFNLFDMFKCNARY